MRNNREENMNFRNQNLNISSVSRGIPFTQNMRFPPPNNYVRQFFLEESRERKCVDNTGHSSVSSGFIESSRANPGNMLHGNRNTEHNLSFTPVNTNSQYGEHQFYNMANSSQMLQAKDESKNNISCGNFPPFHHESRFSYNQNFSSTQIFQDELKLENTKDIGHMTNSKLCNPYLYPYPFKNIQLNVGNFEQNLSKNEMIGEKILDHVTILEPQIKVPLFESPFKQTLADNGGKETHSIFQYDSNTQTNCGSSNDNQISCGKTNHIEHTVQPKSQMPMHIEKVSNGVETKQLKQSEESNTGNTIIKSVEGNSLSNENVQPKKSLEPAGKLSPLLAEKLWDGSIQLSTATTVSAVAFFKSGEKAQDMKWPEHLETKGKVRLQAFEKYIQELPRSRTRTLMLISICWKPGSPEAGLVGMKEIAKVFKEKERVGYAEISRGFDLYVCPRSETIITILAKHGFFKGMAVLEDDQDSLIGCVIWRRANNTPSNSVPKTADKKISPVSSVQESNSPESQDDDLESKQKKADSASLQETSKEPVVSKPVQEQKQEIKSFHSSRNYSFDPSSFTYVGAHAPSQLQPSVLVPPLPNQSNGDLTKVPSGVNKESESGLKVENDDDDGDLPEFDFDYARGVTKLPTNKSVSPPLNQQSLVTEVKSEYRPISSPLKRPLNVEETSNMKYGNTISLPNINITKKSRWDDDDMPEWHPPEIENLDATKSARTPEFKSVKENACQSELASLNNIDKTIEVPSTMHPTVTTCPPFQIQIQNQNISSMDTRMQNQIMRPPLENARETPLMPPRPHFGNQHFPPGMHKPPGNGFIINDFRPPVPNSSDRTKPPTASFSYGIQNLDVSRQWKRQRG